LTGALAEELEGVCQAFEDRLGLAIARAIQSGAAAAQQHQQQLQPQHLLEVPRAPQAGGGVVEPLAAAPHDVIHARC